MKDETNNTATSVGKTVVRSYKDLLRIIQQSIEQYNEIRLVDLLVTFKLDTYTLLGKKGIPIDSSTNTIFVDYPVIIEGIECKELVFNNITFNKEVVFPVTSKSKIGTMSFFDCYFHYETNDSLQIEELSCDDFMMVNCSMNSNASFCIFECLGNFTIDDVEIKGNLVFRNFRLLPQKGTELFIQGRITKDIEFFNCSFGKETIVNVSTEGSVLFEFINYDTKEVVDNNSTVLRQGSICMNGTNIGKQLVFLSCNIGTLDMVNVTMESISEYELRYKRLKNQAATILRNYALQRNDDVAYANYTADIYDDYLRTISIQKLRRWIHKINNQKEQDEIEFKKIERRYKRKSFKRKLIEPIGLLFPNLFSEEGLLLWLNKYSNNYNRSWFRGVVFTCVVAFGWYFALNYWGMQEQFFVIDWSFRGFGEVFEGYLSLLDIFNLIGDKPAFELTPIGKGMMLLAKIVIAYGEWQTIYAFYKYKK